MYSFINTEFFYQLGLKFSTSYACDYRAVSGIRNLNKTQFQGVWPLVKTIPVSLGGKKCVVAASSHFVCWEFGRRCGLLSGRVCEFQGHLIWSLLAWSQGQAGTAGSKTSATAWESAVFLKVQPGGVHGSVLGCGLPCYTILQGWEVAAGWGVSVHNTAKACPWESKKEGELPWIHTITIIKSSTWFSYYRGSKRACCAIASVFKSTELTLPPCEELLLHSQPGTQRQQ